MALGVIESLLCIIILVYLSILLEKLLTLSMYALPGSTSNLDSCKGLKLHTLKGVCTVTLGIARILQLCHARDT